MNRLSGKVAIVTGAALGLGRATAIRMAEEGAAVAILDLHDDIGEALATDLQGKGAKARYWRCDVSREADVARACSPRSPRRSDGWTSWSTTPASPGRTSPPTS